VCGRCKWIAADERCLSHAMDAVVFCMVASGNGGGGDCPIWFELGERVVDIGLLPCRVVL
jgi:hypothetical protein